MTIDLQLTDYEDGYRFACRCCLCGFTWYEQPTELLKRPRIHARMYVSEVEQALVCPRSRDHPRKATQQITIMPIRAHKDHHFIGGLA